MALSAVRVAHVDSVPLAVVRRQARAAELPVVVPKACGAVWEFVRAYRLRAGRNVAVYWDSAIRLHVGVELNGPLPADGDVVPSATPAGLAASVVHLGPYNRLGAAHEAIQNWCAASGHHLAGPNWEVYGHWQEAWNADPSRIRTEVFYQLAAGGSQ
jgi:effector-binding domain-containing protein